MSNRKAPKHFALDFVNSQIVGTKTSLKKAQYPGSDEYKELCKMMKAHPQFKVAEKEIKKRPNKQTYKKLSFDFIETYISIQINAVEIKREYEQVKTLATSLKLGVYPQTKSWFLKRFGHGSDSFDMKKAIDELKAAGLNVERFEAAQSAAQDDVA